MLKGQELGKAIRVALERKGDSQKNMAEFFQVKPPSVQGWLKTGAISKDKLPLLWSYFSDVAGPDHWGLTAFPTPVAPPEPKQPTLFSTELTSRLQQGGDDLLLMAENMLREKLGMPLIKPIQERTGTHE